MLFLAFADTCNHGTAATRGRNCLLFPAGP